jgi:hypothetical protein
MGLTSVDIPAIERKKSHILGAFCILFCLALAFVLNRSAEIRYQSDLFARWYAAQHLFEGGRQLYDAQNANEVILYKSRPTSALEAGFYYPAYLAVLLWPLTRLSFQGAHLLWTIAIQLMYISAIVIVAQVTHWPGSINKLTVFLLCCLMFIPFLQNTIWSQFDAIGVFCLSLSYLELQRGHYFWGGIWASGLLFKPQAIVLALAFLLIWSISSAKRWGFLGGLLLAGLFLWAIAEVVQPGWAGEFIRALGAYQRLPYQIDSVLDKLWNPGRVLSGVLVTGSVGIFIYFRKAPAESPVFSLCLAISLCAWWLVAPIIGMLYLILLPLSVILVISGLQQLTVSGQQYAMWGVLILYLLGWAGFVYGLSRPELYGLHIELAEGALKVLMPLLLLAMCVYGLFFTRKPEVAYA